MISSIFYFADTEQEYLDNFNRRQVKPYTIVFCKDTHSVWKNGVRYGGSTSAETQSLISEIIDRDVAPLMAQLEQAIAQANEALNRAEGRVDEISAGFEDSIRQISAQIDEEKQRLADKVNELDAQVTQSVGDILDDYKNLVNNFDENISNWFDKVAAGEIVHTDGWNEALKAYLTAVETVEVDPETGETTVKTSNIIQDVNGLKSDVQEITKDGDGKIAVAKSEVIQKASEIVSQVTGVTVADDGTVNTSNTNLSQQIADNGNAIIDLRSEWTNADKDTKDVLEWMYSGLTTKAGESGTFNDLVSAASSGDHSAISNILSLVEKIPVYQTDPQTGELLEDEHGNYIPVTDNNGNVVYQTNPDGSFKYKAKASLTSAVDDALSGLITSATSDKAGAELISSLDNQVAALTLLVGDGESSLEGLVTTDNFASELSLVASDQWANTTLATKLRVPKKNDNGDPIYDDHGNPVYEDVADVLGAMRTTIDVLDGGPLVTNSIDAKVNDAISTFELKVNDGEACTTLVNKVNNDSNVLSGLVSKVTGDSSSATMMAKVNNMTAGVATKADLNGALASLIAGGTMIKLVPIDPVEGFSKTVIVNGQTRTVDIPEGSSYSDVEVLYVNVYEDVNEYELLETYSAYPSTIIFEKKSNGKYVRESHIFTPSEFAELWRNVSCGGTRLRYEGDTNTSATGYTTIRIGDVIADDMMEPWYIDTTSIEAGVMTKVDNKIGTATANLVSQSSLSLTMSGVYTEVDARINTATAKLVAKNEFTSAGVIAKVNGNDSNVRIYGKSILLDGDVYMQDAFVQNLCANSLFTSEITALNNQNLTINATDIDFKVPGQSEAKISIDATTGTLRAQEVEIGGIINASSLYRSYAIINLGAYGEELGIETEGTYINIPEFYGPNGAGLYYNIPEFENNALPDIIKFDILQTANSIPANDVKPSGDYYTSDLNYFIKFPSPSLCPGRLIEIYFKRRLDYNYNWSDQLKFSSSSNYRRTPGVVLFFPGGNYSEFYAYAEPIIYDPTSTTELYSKRDGTWFGGSLAADDWWGYIRVISKDGQWIVLDAKNCKTFYPY